VLEAPSAAPAARAGLWNDAGDWQAAALVAYCAVFVAWELFAGAGHDPVLCDFAFVPAGALASWLVFRAGLSHADPGYSRGLRLIGLAFGLQCLGDLFWFAHAALRGQDPALSVTILVYAVFYPVFIAGALALPRAAGRVGRRVFWLDTAAAVVGGAMVVGYQALDLAARGGDWPRTAIAATYCLGDLVVLLLFVALAKRHGSEQRPAFVMLALGLLLLFVGDVLFSLAHLAGPHVKDAIANAMLMGSWACVGVAGQLYRRLGPGPVARPPSASDQADLALVPFAVVALGYGVLLVAALRGRPSVILVVGAALLTAIVLVRQYASARENARLVQERTALHDKARFEALVESAADVLVLVDERATFRYLSGSVRGALGRGPAELVGTNAFDLMHPDDVAAAQRVLGSCLERPGVMHHAAFRFRHADGSWRDIEADGLNQLANPEIEAITATFRDVTARKTAEAELRGQKDLLANLLAVARATAESPSLEVTLRNALGVMKSLVGASGGSIFLLDERGAVRRSVYAEGDAVPEAMQQTHAERVLREGLAGWVARHREAAILPDVARDARWMSLPDEPMRSALSVPILVGEALVGVLTLVDGRVDFFDAQDLRFVQGACEQIALALRNAQVFDALGRMAHRQRLLNDFVRTAGLRLDPDAMIEAALQTISRRTHWINVALSVPDTEGRFLRIRALPAGQAPERPQRVDEGIAGRAFVSGRTQHVPDVSRDPDYVPASVEVRSELAVPLRRGDRVLGVLNLESEELNGFDEEDLRLAEALADTIALSLDDALTYRRLADESELVQAVIRASRDGIVLIGADEQVKLVNAPALRLLRLSDTPLDWLGRPAASLAGLPAIRHGEGELSERGSVVRYFVEPVATGTARGRLVVLRDVSEERRLETLREDLTHTLVHDLRTPLNSIMGFLEVLGQAPSLKDPHQELLDIAGRATERLVSLIDTILDVSRLEKGVMPVVREAVALGPLIADVQALLKPVARQRGIDLLAVLPPELPAVNADPGLLRRIVENLLSNALRHTPRKGTVRIAALLQPAPPRSIEIRVSDTGRGIPAEEQLRIFEKYATGREPGRGTGLGLAFCRLAVEAHGGRIRVESAPGEGATFVFTLELT